MSLVIMKSIEELAAVLAVMFIRSLFEEEN